MNLYYVLLFSAIVVAVSTAETNRRTNARLRLMHRLLLQMAEKMGLEPDPLHQELIAILQTEGKIAATKRARSALGLPLKEAKEYVDRIQK